MLKKLVNGVLMEMTSQEETEHLNFLKYAPTLGKAKALKKREAIVLVRSLLEAVDQITGDPAAYLATLKADWAIMESDIQALTTINQVRDYVINFTPAP